jgi:2,3-dihydroxybenzoate-AMP ligase
VLTGCTPWPPDFVARYRAEGYWQDITLSEMVEATIRRFPAKVALVDGERRLTYAELGRAVDQLACAFVRRGLKPLDRVLFQLANGAELMIAFLALVKAGIIPVMALPAHRQHEISHFVAHSGALAYLIPDTVRDFDYREMAAELAPCCPSLTHVFVNGRPGPGQHDLRAMMAETVDAATAAALAARLSPADEVALMLLSGGTTGLPKMIPRTHNDYVYSCRQSAACWGLDERSVSLVVLQMAHNYTLAAPGWLGVFAVGGTVVVAPANSAEAVFPLIEREGVTLLCAAPPLVTSWLNSPVPDRHNLSSLRLLSSGGALLAPELRRQVEQRFGCTYVESFGTAEGFLNQTRPDDPDDIRMRSEGRPISPADEMRVVDEFDREIPDGERGELQVRGPYTIRGYYNAPEANAKAFTADGFYRMGDMVRRAGGTLFLEGRKKDLINRGGEKISSEEVENHLLAHPAVQNVCVVAMPDPIYGEKACAFVILRPAQRLDFTGLTEFLRGRGIAKFKFPERLEVVDSFPMSPANKILRRELRAIIVAELAAEEKT